MSPGIWLPGAKDYDMSKTRGNGVFTTNHPFLGVILHDNESNGNLAGFITGGGGSNDVCPNFQVYKDGSFDQYLPLDWQPWAQSDGNYNYAAIETEGYTTEALTDAQIATIVTILKAYRDNMGMVMQLADEPGDKGFGVHYMGGKAWGGHSCPGPIRAAQRQAILDLAKPIAPPTPKELYMKDIIYTAEAPAAGVWFREAETGNVYGVQNGDDISGLTAAGAVNVGKLSAGLHEEFLDASHYQNTYTTGRNNAGPNGNTPTK